MILVMTRPGDGGHGWSGHLDVDVLDVLLELLPVLDEAHPVAPVPGGDVVDGDGAGGVSPADHDPLVPRTHGAHAMLLYRALFVPPGAGPHAEEPGGVRVAVQGQPRVGLGRGAGGLPRHMDVRHHPLHHHHRHKPWLHLHLHSPTKYNSLIIFNSRIQGRLIKCRVEWYLYNEVFCQKSRSQNVSVMES